MKFFLTILVITILFSSCDNKLYEREVYKEKLEKLKKKEADFDLRLTKLKKKEKDIKTGWEMGEIIVAGKEIKAGTRLTSDMLKTGVMPLKYIRDGMLKPVKRGYIIGQPVTVDIHVNDPIFDYDIKVIDVPFDGISKIIPKGYRAVGLKVDETSSVSNLLRPSNHIDINWIYKDPKNKQLISKTLLEDVIIISVGSYTSDNIKQAVKNETIAAYKSISILLLPEEVKVLDLAKKSGSISISLRNPEDYLKLPQNIIKINDLIKNSEVIKKLKKKRDNFNKSIRIEIIRK